MHQFLSKKSNLLSKSDPITGLDRPLVLQEVEVPRLARQSAHECGKVLSPMHRPENVSECYTTIFTDSIPLPNEIQQIAVLIRLISVGYLHDISVT
jgi:hypothetical protein